MAVIDQFLLETEPQESDQMIEHLGTAFPVYINFAVTNMERLLREVRSSSDVPVIIMTSSDSPLDRTMAAKRGSTRYFKKPIELDEFLMLGGLVREVLNDHSTGPDPNSFRRVCGSQLSGRTQVALIRSYPLH